MIDGNPVAGSLVLYKIHPARVTEVDDKIAIDLGGGRHKRVRPKDVELLHPGPLQSLGELVACDAEIEEGWELLQGESTTLPELAELLYGDFTPATAWSTWALVSDGLYFSGRPGAIAVHDRDAVAGERARRERKAHEAAAWAGFVARVGEGAILDEDRERLVEVEKLALNQTAQSRILKELGHQETPVNAHRMLVQVGYWHPDHNPFPARFGAPSGEPQLPVPELADEPRLDLTRLPAFAIDDEGNADPDDAVSLDGERIWVHVADVAALVPPDSGLDLEARARGSNYYLPEQVIPMLPTAVTERLGLGLHEESPALSFGFRLADDGAPVDLEIHPSKIRAQRISYTAADRVLADHPVLGPLKALADRFRARRIGNGATSLALPEVTTKVVDGEVVIRALPRLDSREMVTDLMLMAGEAVARWCLERGIAVPFATQPPPEQPRTADDLAAMHAYRRCFKPTRVQIEPAPHAGLGLDAYCRATSPLRRYSDLLVHQQIRAVLAGREPIDAAGVASRNEQAEIGGGNARRTERISNQHWKLVFLRAHPKWQGEAVIVENEGPKVTVLIPELAFETRLRVKGESTLNRRLRVQPSEVDLPDLGVWFRVLG